MAFLNNLKSAPMPPIKNVLKDAWQTAKQSMPDKQRQQQYEDPSSEYGGSSQISNQSSSHRPHNVHFADNYVEPGQQYPTEMNPLNPFNTGGGGANPSNPFSNGLGYEGEMKSDYQYEETGFNQGEYGGGYQQGGFPARYETVDKFL
jgi:solute carrier family 32 (vesicular inhibitory amino acid transporter)